MSSPEQLSESEILARSISSTPQEAPKTDEIEVLFSNTKTFQINGESVTIKHFSFGQLPAVISLLKGVGGVFAHYKNAGTLNSVEAMMDIVSSGGENLIQALVLNTGKPRAFFDEVPPDEGVKLMLEFLQMNIGFFTNRVVPVLQGQMK